MSDPLSLEPSSLATIRAAPLPLSPNLESEKRLINKPNSISPSTRPKSPATTRRAPPTIRKPVLPNRNFALPTATVLSREEIERFEGLCYRYYHEADANSHSMIQSILSKSTNENRNLYTKVMNAIRSNYHLTQEIQRRAELERLLNETLCGAVVKNQLKITEGGTEAMRSKQARVIRLAALKSFIHTQFLTGLTSPFFKSLFALLYLQTRFSTDRRAEWIVDVAVFSESGGSEWTRESIELLKGVLGFEESIQILSVRESQVYSDNESDQEEEEEEEEATPIMPPIIPPHRNSVPNPIPPLARDRSFSDPRTSSSNDPFLDPETRRFSISQTDPLDFASPLLPSSPSPFASPPPKKKSPKKLETPKPQFRIFIFNDYITNPEIYELLNLFPKSIKSKAAEIEFAETVHSSSSSISGKELEEGRRTGMKNYSFGHGEVRIGEKKRALGWEGTRVERFWIFWKRLFGRSL